MRKLRVFVSSLIKGLRDQRRWAKNALSSLGVACGVEPILWEDEGSALGIPFTTGLSPQRTCLLGVERADIVLALLGARYGQAQESGLSATHEEIRHALRKGKEVVLLGDSEAQFERQQQALIDEIGRWSSGKRLNRVSFADKAQFVSAIRDKLTPLARALVSSELIDQVLAEPEAVDLFESSACRGSAQCSAFLAGDWSVLGTKRALLVPISARVRVAASTAAAPESRVHVYERQREGHTWALNRRYSERLSEVVRNALTSNLMAKHFPQCPRGLQATVFSDVPFGSSVHEDAAFSLALSASLTSRSRTRRSTLSLAGLFLAHWYPQVSWATLVRSHETDPLGRHLMLFDRTRDGGIDLQALPHGSPTNFLRNTCLDPRSWSVRRYHFNLNRVSVWLGEPTAIDIDETLAVYQTAVRRLNWKLCSEITQQMCNCAKSGSDTGIGIYMQAHQLALADAGFLDPEYQKLVAWVNAQPGVLGAKSACARKRGALVLLTDHPVEPDSALTQLLVERGLRPLVLQNLVPLGTIHKGTWSGHARGG